MTADPRKLAAWGAATGLGSIIGLSVVATLSPEGLVGWGPLAFGVTGVGGLAAVLTGLRKQLGEEQIRAKRSAESEKLLSALLDDGSDWMWRTDAEGRFTWYSSGFHEKFGITPEQSIGKTRVELAGDSIHHDPPAWAAHLATLRRREPFRNFTYRADGIDARRTRWLKITGRPRFDEDGTFLGYSGVGTDVTAEQVARHEANEAQDLLLSALDTVAAGFALFDADDRLRRYNKEVAERAEFLGVELFIGMRFEQMVRRLADAGTEREVDPEAVSRWAEDRLSRHRSSETPFVYRSFNGQWLQVSEHPLPDGGLVVLTTDVSELKSEDEIRRQQEIAKHYMKMSATLDNLGQGVCLLDPDGRMESWNPVFLDMMSICNRHPVSGITLSDLLGPEPEQGGDGMEFARDVAAELLSGSGSPLAGGILERTRPDGTVLEIRLNPMPDGGRLAVFTDITERKRGEDIVVYMANHDPLTDLPNRSLFRERLTQAMAQAQRADNRIAVLYFDLDGFKDVNDMMGHGAGDQLLIEVANRLNKIARASDSVSRLGGDEFAVIQSDITNPSDAAVMALRILESLNEPMNLNDQEIQLSASIGITVYPDDASSVGDLLQAADLAMYRAKSEAGGAYKFYESRMNTEVQQRKSLETDIKRALDTGQFNLAYQPKVDLQTDQIVGIEALIRWTHVSRGPVSPRELIDVAEACGLILPLSEWVLNRALSDAARWPEVRATGIRIAVNMSPLQFKRQNLLHLVADALHSAGLPASTLEIEITEGTLLPDVDGNRETLEALADLGVNVALDDFGTGYSSLAYLKKFPVNAIKIDRRFIQNMDKDPDNRLLVKAMIEMGRTLRLETVAEGIENEAERTTLRELGCDVGQGFLMYRPMPAEAMGDLLAGRDRRSEDTGSLRA